MIDTGRDGRGSWPVATHRITARWKKTASEAPANPLFHRRLNRNVTLVKKHPTSRAAGLGKARSMRADQPRDGFSKRYNRSARQKRLGLYALVAMMERNDETAMALVRHQRISAWARTAAERRARDQERNDT